MPYILAYDLGTGGAKASLHDADGHMLANAYLPYPTYYPQADMHEQRPADWWDAVCRSTHLLLEQSGIAGRDVAALALAGHSLVAAPVAADGTLLTELVPIWSDTRATAQAERFFAEVPYEAWYLTTGNGDPAATYAVMKMMWFRDHYPELYRKTAVFLGSKDYINYLLCGTFATDWSYASGSGLFDLAAWRCRDDFIAASGIDAQKLPPILPPHAVVGRLQKGPAAVMGLPDGLPVVCGGVDNAVMALGTCGVRDGAAYTSLGSCCWVAAISRKPVVDMGMRSFVFAHAEQGYYASAVSIFSGGTALDWVRRMLCPELPEADAFHLMDSLAEKAPPGCNGVLFNPSLAGGSNQHKSAAIRGGFVGLQLGTTREELIRATLEGVALDLGVMLHRFAEKVSLADAMPFVGGGSKSALWRQIFANVYGKTVIKTNIGQNATSLGAAAIAARGCGLWQDYSPILTLHREEARNAPVPEEQRVYQRLLRRFEAVTDMLADIAEKEGGYEA